MASSTVDSEDASGTVLSPPRNEVVTDTSGVMLLEYIQITQRVPTQIREPVIRDPVLRNLALLGKCNKVCTECLI